MEITKCTKGGYKVSVIFNGPTYFFYSDYCGLFAIAERIFTEDNEEEHFSLVYGNEHMRIDFCKKTAVSFVTKAEQKYITKRVYFDETEYEELNKTRFLVVTAEKRQ